MSVFCCGCFRERGSVGKEGGEGRRELGRWMEFPRG